MGIGENVGENVGENTGSSGYMPTDLEMLIHASLSIVTSGQVGTTLGTRPDFNTDLNTWEGHTHIHFRFTDLSKFTAPLAEGETKDGFDILDKNGKSWEIGGPSQSNRYMRASYSVTTSEPGLRTTTPSSGSGVGLKVYYCWKYNGDGVNPDKIFRYWENTTQQNWILSRYLVKISGGGPCWYPAYGIDCGINANFDNLTLDDGSWKRLEIMQLDSTGNENVGDTYMRIDGEDLEFNNGSYTCDAFPEPGAVSVIPLVCDSAFDGLSVEMTWPNSSTVDTDETNYTDLYVDFTPARVEITDGSKTEIQIITEWTSTVITYAFNKGELSSGSGMLYVYDADDSQIGSGVSVTIE